MKPDIHIYLDTPIAYLHEQGIIDRAVLRACEAAKPKMTLAGDIVSHFEKTNSFADVPGCRRPGRILDTLNSLMHAVKRTNTPTEQKPRSVERLRVAQVFENASFDFLTSTEKDVASRFRQEEGYLPMFYILERYMNSPGATRNDIVMAAIWGMRDDLNEPLSTLADIGDYVNLSRERVRQIMQTYELPDILSPQVYWNAYADHSSYYIDASNPVFTNTVSKEKAALTFDVYADVLQHATMMRNIENIFLARRGWENEISAWVRKLEKLSSMPRPIDSRISLEGLAMGGALDTRIALVVLNQIAPALGLKPDAPGHIILPKNM